jgi:hypothetical protein
MYFGFGLGFASDVDLKIGRDVAEDVLRQVEMCRGKQVLVSISLRYDARAHKAERILLLNFSRRSSITDSTVHPGSIDHTSSDDGDSEPPSSSQRISTRLLSRPFEVRPETYLVIRQYGYRQALPSPRCARTSRGDRPVRLGVKPQAYGQGRVATGDDRRDRFSARVWEIESDDELDDECQGWYGGERD